MTKRSLRCLGVSVAVIGVALAAQALVGSAQAAPPPTPDTPPAVPNNICNLTGNVFFQFYSSQVTPTTNGCWNYYRPIVTTGTFQTCSVNPLPEHYYGNGTDKIYDDTNTSHTSPTDSSAIGTCLSNTPSANNLYMVKRPGFPRGSFIWQPGFGCWSC